MTPQEQIEAAIASLIDEPRYAELMDLLKENYIYVRSHVQGDSHETAFREGQRDMVNFLCNIYTIQREQWQKNHKVKR